MEFIGSPDGVAAPRLAAARPGPVLLRDLFDQLYATLTRLAEHGWAHGDLSAYNILLDGDRLVLIDWPQIVDIIGNPQGSRSCTVTASPSAGGSSGTDSLWMPRCCSPTSSRQPPPPDDDTGPGPEVPPIADRPRVESAHRHRHDSTHPRARRRLRARARRGAAAAAAAARIPRRGVRPQGRWHGRTRRHRPGLRRRSRPAPVRHRPQTRPQDTAAARDLDHHRHPSRRHRRDCRRRPDRGRRPRARDPQRRGCAHVCTARVRGLLLQHRARGEDARGPQSDRLCSAG